MTAIRRFLLVVTFQHSPLSAQTCRRGHHVKGLLLACRSYRGKLGVAVDALFATDAR